MSGNVASRAPDIFGRIAKCRQNARDELTTAGIPADHFQSSSPQERIACRTQLAERVERRVIIARGEAVNGLMRLRQV